MGACFSIEIRRIPKNKVHPQDNERKDSLISTRAYEIVGRDVYFMYKNSVSPNNSVSRDGSLRDVKKQMSLPNTKSGMYRSNTSYDDLRKSYFALGHYTHPNIFWNTSRRT